MSVVNRIHHRPAWGRLVLVLCLAAAVAACKKDAASDAGADPAAGTGQPAAVPPQQAVSAQVAAMSAGQLRTAASTALREQRLYAPAGNNAMEYYVALRDKQPNDPAVASALTDLMPYTVIATEQSIGRDDFVEAQRLYALMEKTDPQAPALPRLKRSIADAQASLAQRTAAETQTQTEAEAQRQAELERERLAEQQRAQQQAATQLAQQQAAAQTAAAPPAAEQRTAAPPAVEQRTAEQPAQPAAPASPPPATDAPTAASTASNEIRAISTPSPAYPQEALRDGQSGEVQVEFTINPDGSVSNPRVVRANPPRVFDRAALSAVRRWRFQPVASATTTRRTIGFNPGN